MVGEPKEKSSYLEYIREMERSSRFLYLTENTIRIPLIKLHTKKGSLYYTDDHTAYATLDLIGKHQIIADGMEEYVCEDTTHINGIEGFWIYEDMAISLSRCTQEILSSLSKRNRI